MSFAFQPTLPARGATAKHRRALFAYKRISTHAPRTGSDATRSSSSLPTRNFNPRSPHGERREAHMARHGKMAISTHAPRTGSDEWLDVGFNVTRPFQPTLPARGATSFGVHRQNTNYFNPRSPHGERQIEYLSARGEDDFNPRSPHGERLNLDTDGFQREMISTHAPRTGSDTLHKSAPRSTFRFQPTLPARGATGLLRFFLRFSAFQPTLPARGATILCLQVEQNNLFQPTLPARGATASARTGDRFAPHFNPRSPHGERQYYTVMFAPYYYFNPRSPHGERRRTVRNYIVCRYFNPRSPHGERRLMKIVKMNPAAAFQPTLPARGATSPHCPNRIGSPISTHAPRTGSDSQGQAPRGNLAISTHAPRTGSDDDGKPTWQPFAQFQPTLPARGATRPLSIRAWPT